MKDIEWAGLKKHLRRRISNRKDLIFSNQSFVNFGFLFGPKNGFSPTTYWIGFLILMQVIYFQMIFSYLLKQF